jgi:hypothetical protein
MFNCPTSTPINNTLVTFPNVNPLILILPTANPSANARKMANSGLFCMVFTNHSTIVLNVIYVNK